MHPWYVHDRVGSILDTVSKILNDIAIFSIITISKIHFAFRILPYLLVTPPGKKYRNLKTKFMAGSCLPLKMLPTAVNKPELLNLTVHSGNQ